MLKPFANSARSVASGPLTWRTWVGLIALPVLVVGLLSWALWAPTQQQGNATAAVVNNDEPATVNGRTLPIGRELAGKLTQDDTSPYDWVLTDADDADDGLSAGRYSAVVTVPKDFSKKTTSPATEDPLRTSRGLLDIQTSTTAGLADPVASASAAESTLGNLNRQVVETTLDQMYGGFTSIHDQMGKAAGGARELADGTGQVAGGAAELSTGSGKLNSAAGELASGASELSSGIGQLSTGSGQLSSGLADAKRQTAPLPAQTKKLAKGAREVANGNKKIADTVVPLADKVIEAIDALPSATAAAQRFQDLAARCPADDGPSQEKFCAELQKAADKFSGEATKIDNSRTRIRKAAVDTKAAVRKLAKGADQVADGNEQLAAKTPELVDGISSAASGAKELDRGVKEAGGGARQLKAGSGKLHGATGELSTGAKKLAGGANQTDEGAKKLASEIAKGQEQVPSYTEKERDHLKKVAASPASAGAPGLMEFGPAAVAVFVSLALWACALATYILTRAVPGGVLTSREATWKIIVRAAVPGATTAVIAATVVSLVLAPFLSIGVIGWFAFLGVAILAALTFTALNQAVVAIFKRPGRFASVAVLVLALATSVISTVPAPIAAIGAVLPTHGAIEALRVIVLGSGAPTSGIIELLVWLAIGMVATIAVTDLRRAVPAKQLRLSTRGVTDAG